MSKLRRRLLGASPEEWARWEKAARQAFPTVLYKRGFYRPLQRSLPRWVRRALNAAADAELGKDDIKSYGDRRLVGWSYPLQSWRKSNKKRSGGKK